MLKRIAFVLVVCTCVSVAFGAAVRITDFDAVGEPLDANANAMAILNYAAGKDRTIVQIIMSNFTPNTPYDVRLFTVISEVPVMSDSPAGVIMTDDQGHATLHQEFLADKSTWDVLLYVNNFTELRAVGLNPS